MLNYLLSPHSVNLRLHPALCVSFVRLPSRPKEHCNFNNLAPLKTQTISNGYNTHYNTPTYKHNLTHYLNNTL